MPGFLTTELEGTTNGHWGAVETGGVIINEGKGDSGEVVDAGGVTNTQGVVDCVAVVDCGGVVGSPAFKAMVNSQ